ncbi:hypothetical protein L1049_027123 [Liquidambar formosana]|uniref:Uncharacterized protein n=1 Tax=Liquidambar formosana TaxID=63359 RepID=A0AAP0R3A6_LIQFO
MNNSGRRRESVRRSNSINDQPKTPSKKDQMHSQPQLQGQSEKPEPAISSESVDSTSGIDARHVSLDFKEEDVRGSKEDGQSAAEPNDWEDVVDVLSPTLKISNNGGQVHGGLRRHEEDVDGVTVGILS